MALKAEMKILVVDDMTTMRKIIKRMLQEMGFKNIHEADDGKPALKMVLEAQAIGDPFQFILSDWNMPDMSGIDFLKEVRANPDTAKIPFLMVTAESEQGNVIIAVKAGVSNFIIKPFSKETLIGKIEKIFGVEAK